MFLREAQSDFPHYASVPGLVEQERADVRVRIVSLISRMQKKLQDGFQYPLQTTFLLYQMNGLKKLLKSCGAEDPLRVADTINNIFDKFLFLSSSLPRGEIERIQSTVRCTLEEAVIHFHTVVFPTLCQYKDALDCSMEKVLTVYHFETLFNHAPKFAWKIIRSLRKDGLAAIQIRDIAITLQSSREAWNRLLADSGKQSLLWRTKAYRDKEPRTVQYMADGTVVVFFNKAHSSKDPLIGYGTYKKIVFARDLLRGKVRARVSAEYSIANLFEANLAISLSGKKNFVYTHPQSLVIYRGKKTNCRKISYIQEYCNGGDLERALNRVDYPPLDEAEKTLIAHSVLDGVDFLHRQMRIIHRDIKTDNVLLIRHPTTRKVIRAALSDFSFSCHLGDIDRRKEDVLSPLYAPPEVLLAHSKKSRFLANQPSRDCWSLGILLFEIFQREISGRRTLPWLRIKKIEILTAYFKQHKDSWISSFNDHPMSPIIRGLLRRDPEARISAREALALTEKFIEAKNCHV